MFGASEVAIGQRQLIAGDWPSAKARSLFLLLASAPGYRLQQEQALDALWPDFSPDAARNALYKAAHGLRRTLEPDLAIARQSRYVQSGGGAIALVGDMIAWIDVEQFEAALARAGAAAADDARDEFRIALGLYRGDFAADERYADWPVARREALRHSRSRAVHTLARLDLEAGVPALSIPFLEALHQDDPASEETSRDLMRALEGIGQREQALRQFARCRDALARELGTDPGPETTALADRIRADMARAAEPRASRPRRFSNLPALPTATVGRDREIDDLYDLVRETDSRMVTLLGTGGIGKTRLAIEVAAELAPHFDDGVGFVSLAPTTDPGQFFDTLGQTLGVRPDPRRSMRDVVLAALEERSQLLVLDNFEHLLDAASDVAAILAQCRNIRILVTTREPLRIRAERIARIDTLDVPDPGAGLGAGDLARIDSVALFVQAMQAHTPAFRLADANASTVAGLCARLEGLPLAIEIAAARCIDASLDEVLAQLANRMHALREGPRDLPPRQRALRRTIDWSYELLGDDERALFRRLSVFVGGAEPDALLAVCGPGSGHLASSLVDKSLASWRIVDGVRRLTMLETVREFGQERLEADGEAVAMRERHAAFFSGLAGSLYPLLMRAGHTHLYERLDRDLPNIRSALGDAIGRGDAVMALQLAGRIGPFWHGRGLAREGLDWSLKALARSGGHHSADRAVTCFWASRCAEYIGDAGECRRLLDEARETWEALGDEAGASLAMTFDALLIARQGDFEAAESAHRAALDRTRAAGIDWAAVVNLRGLAKVHDVRGEFDVAVSLMRQGLEITEQANLSEDIRSFFHLYFAELLFDSPRRDEVLRHVEVAERLAWQIGQPRWIAVARFIRGRLFAAAGNLDQATDAFLEAAVLFDACHARREAASARLAMSRTVLREEFRPEIPRHMDRAIRELERTAGDVGSLLLVIGAAALLASRVARHEEAIAFARAGHMLVSKRGAVLAEQDMRNFQRVETVARAALPPADLEAARRRGATLTDDAIFDLALRLCAVAQTAA